MNIRFKNKMGSTFAALIAIVCGYGYISSAGAVALYDASAFLEFTLFDVQDQNGGTVQQNQAWSVTADGFVFDSDSFWIGDAAASSTTDVAGPGVSVDVGDSVSNTSRSQGSAGNGFGAAESFAFTDLSIFIDNFSGQTLTFIFDYSYQGSALADIDDGAESAFGAAVVDALDDLGTVDIFEEAFADSFSGPLTDGFSGADRFAFTLLDGEFNFISAFVDSQGIASSPGTIPEPSLLMLLGLGGLGLGVVRRRSAR